MLWWNYYLSIVTDPGRVPAQWVHIKIIQRSPCREATLAEFPRCLRSQMYPTNKVLKSTGWGIPDTVGNASGTNHLERITVRTARRESLVYRIHATV